MEHQDHEYYMNKCIELAKVAKLNGDSPVGSVLVLNGEIVGEGIEGGKTFKALLFIQKLKLFEMPEPFFKHTIFQIVLCTRHTSLVLCVLMS